METLQNYLANYPSEYSYIILGVLLFITSMGIFPANTDLLMIASAVLAGQGILDITSVVIVCTVALSLGESTMFMLGHSVGERILDFKYVKRVFSQEKKDQIKEYIGIRPKKFLLSIRVIFAFRAYYILSLGSFKLSKRLFFSMHLIIVFLYVPVLMFTSYSLFEEAAKLFK